ncbi:MAG TPA: aldo/keto reductase, partial [Bacteroidota bacterium]
MNRRNLLGVLASLGAVAAALGKAGSTETPENRGGEQRTSRPAESRSGDMLYRTLGKTGVKVSVIGLGGSHLGEANDANEAARIVRTGVDRGITFLDNSWDYHDGKSEEWMGNALREGYRDKVFLMTKFDGRTKEAAARQIDESLKRLRTDHLDLLQFHENIRME